MKISFISPFQWFWLQRRHYPCVYSLIATQILYVSSHPDLFSLSHRLHTSTLSLSLSLTPYQHSTSTYIILTLTTAGLAWSSAAADCRKEGAQREQSNRERRREEVSLFWFHFSAWLDARTRSKEKVDSPVRWFWILFSEGTGDGNRRLNEFWFKRQHQ